MFKPDEIPFPVATTNDELDAMIRSFDYDQYKERSKEFIEQTGIMEDGHASERLVDLLMDYHYEY